VSKRQLIYLGVVGALALVSLAFPTLIFLGLFVGVVPGLILWAAIPLFGYSLLAIVVRAATKGFGNRASWLCVVAAIATLAVLPPAILNLYITRAIDELVSGDRPLAEPLPKIETLGYFGKNSPGLDPSDCDGICQRLLYNGAVKAVIVGESYIADEMKFSKYVTLWTIERRGACPLPAKKNNRSELLDAVKSRIAAGECLIAGKGDISQAEAVIGAARLDSREVTLPRMNWGERIALYMRMPQGLEEKFRRTYIQTRKVLTPFLFGYFAETRMFPDLGIATYQVKLNEFEITDVFRNDFKLDVSDIKDLPGHGDRDLMVAAIADKSRPADDPAFALSDKILTEIGKAPSQNPQADAAIVLAMVGDARVQRLGGLRDAVWRLKQDASGLAGPMLDRIMASDVAKDMGALRAVADAATLLPDEAFAPVIGKLEALAHDESRRAPAFQAISRLSDGGAAMAPLLTELLRTGWDAKNAEYRYAPDLQIGALLGLCRLGEEGSSAAPTLIELLNKSEVQRDNLSSRGELAIRTLNRMGQWPQARSKIMASDKMFGQIDHSSGSGKLEGDCRY
jgi:hypothetical protein